eukprot:scaffold7358_cov66-Phaeocystis_antarctica.AAC.4
MSVIWVRSLLISTVKLASSRTLNVASSVTDPGVAGRSTCGSVRIASTIAVPAPQALPGSTTVTVVDAPEVTVDCVPSLRSATTCARASWRHEVQSKKRSVDMTISSAPGKVGKGSNDRDRGGGDESERGNSGRHAGLMAPVDRVGRACVHPQLALSGVVRDAVGVLGVNGHSRARVEAEVHVGGDTRLTFDKADLHDHACLGGHRDWAHGGAVVGPHVDRGDAASEGDIRARPPFDAEEVVARIPRALRHLDLPPRVRCALHLQTGCTGRDAELSTDASTVPRSPTSRKRCRSCTRAAKLALTAHATGAGVCDQTTSVTTADCIETTDTAASTTDSEAGVTEIEALEIVTEASPGDEAYTTLPDRVTLPDASKVTRSVTSTSETFPSPAPPKTATAVASVCWYSGEAHASAPAMRLSVSSATWPPVALPTDSPRLQLLCAAPGAHPEAEAVGHSLGTRTSGRARANRVRVGVGLSRSADWWRSGSKGDHSQQKEQPHRADTSAVPLVQPVSGEEHWHPGLTALPGLATTAVATLATLAMRLSVSSATCTDSCCGNQTVSVTVVLVPPSSDTTSTDAVPPCVMLLVSSTVHGDTTPKRPAGASMALQENSDGDVVMAMG